MVQIPVQDNFKKFFTKRQKATCYEEIPRRLEEQFQEEPFKMVAKEDTLLRKP